MGPLALVGQLGKDKENSEFKPVKLLLKIDIVSPPARATGFVYIYINVHTHTHSHTHIFIYIYIYICLSMYSYIYICLCIYFYSCHRWLTVTPTEVIWWENIHSAEWKPNIAKGRGIFLLCSHLEEFLPFWSPYCQVILQIVWRTVMWPQWCTCLLVILLRLVRW